MVLAVAQLSGCASGSSGAGAPVGAPAQAVAPPAGPPSGAPAPKPLARSVPVRLEIPAIGVDSPVIPVGLAADGTVGVPPIERNAPAGWYQNSPTPGQLGPSVILGHVTVGQYGDGVFLHLARLVAGDRVVLVLQDGTSAVFTVDSVQTVSKAHFPTQSVYGNVDRPELRLITCAGPRGADGRGYPDNTIVYAGLASAS
ncbi:class F sortase [Streptacidiphilus sp. PB12-B1b]|uniref:class F sortase n=1 Tax=Streptacidiphilus sp. PB12-B1b TaxID=2705012 RepID=UPI001CDCA108|nr:class F sortase [Streptacidiphilus sp. PB12-B1b]